MEIPLDTSTNRFLQGVSCAQQVLDAHEGVEFHAPEQRVLLFWYTAGLLAAAEYGVTDVNDEIFLRGLMTRAPELCP